MGAPTVTVPVTEAQEYRDSAIAAGLSVKPFP